MNQVADMNRRTDDAMKRLIARIQGQRGSSRMVVLLLVVFAIFALMRPQIFLNPVNLQNIGVAAPEIGLISLAVMIAMLTGGIDLSVVSIANATAITISALYTAISTSQGVETAETMAIPIILAGFMMGIICGAINGFLIAYVGITPILTTLGTMQLFNGLAIVWTGGVTISGAPTVLRSVGRSTIAGVPLLFLIFVIAAVILAIMINRMVIGRKIQLQGANPVAAQYSGISARRTLMSTYMMCGALGGLAGILFLCRNPAASADYGSSYVLLSIVIAVLGGTNPNGGFATVTGVVLATLVLQVTASGFTALRLSDYQYAIAQGVLLILVMVFDQVRLRRRRAPTTPRPDATTEASEPREDAKSR